MPLSNIPLSFPCPPHPDRSLLRYSIREPIDDNYCRHRLRIDSLRSSSERSGEGDATPLPASYSVSRAPGNGFHELVLSWSGLITCGIHEEGTKETQRPRLSITDMLRFTHQRGHTFTDQSGYHTLIY